MAAAAPAVICAAVAAAPMGDGAAKGAVPGADAYVPPHPAPPPSARARRPSPARPCSPRAARCFATPSSRNARRATRPPTPARRARSAQTSLPSPPTSPAPPTPLRPTTPLHPTTPAPPTPRTPVASFPVGPASCPPAKTPSSQNQSTPRQPTSPASRLVRPLSEAARTDARGVGAHRFFRRGNRGGPHGSRPVGLGASAKRVLRAVAASECVPHRLSHGVAACDSVAVRARTHARGDGGRPARGSSVGVQVRTAVEPLGCLRPR